MLMLGVSYRNVAFPSRLRLLDKRGNSNTEERISLITDVIDCCGRDCTDCILADREFMGEQWLRCLNDNVLRYFIRICDNFRIFCPRKQEDVMARHLFHNLKVGELPHYQKIVRLHGELCYLSGTRTVKDEKVAFCITVSYNKPEQALDYYKKR
jgi:hypothetical protein